MRRYFTYMNAGSVAFPFLFLVGVAFLGLAKGQRAVFAVGKTAATLSLLLLIDWRGVDDWPICAIALGILLSAAGDAVLVSDSARAFATGLVLFLLAHVAYIVAFLAVPGVTFSRAAVFAVLALTLSGIGVLRRMWIHITVNLRWAVALYAVVIHLMLGAALALGTRTGVDAGVAGAALAVGAVLFLASDIHLAWTTFRASYRGARVVTLSTYWAGQFLIVASACDLMVA